MNLGKELKRIIKEEKGFSLTWVAEQLGENEKTFTGWLNLNRISGENLIRVANVCNIDLNELKVKLREGDANMKLFWAKHEDYPEDVSYYAVKNADDLYDQISKQRGITPDKVRKTFLYEEISTVCDESNDKRYKIILEEVYE